MEEVKGILVFLTIGMLLFSLAPVIAQDETSSGDSSTTSQDTSTETQTSDRDDSTQTESTTTEEFNVDAGMTPDNPFYFLDNMFERPGDNPEKALDYKEEKIAEAQVMVDEGKPEEARQVLEKALEYDEILEREVSPEIKARIDESSRRVVNVLNDLREQSVTEGWEMEGLFDENIAKEKNIAIAAELAAKINELCVTLAKLDPLQYSDVCKSEAKSPKWMRERDKEMTKEQEAQAKVFVDKLSQCMENPKSCDCQGMGVQSFENFCEEKSALAVKCEGGDRESCKGLDEADPSDLLPDYLVDVYYDLKDKYSKSKFEKFMPPECEKAGATSPDACEKIMFKLNAPKECIDVGLDGSSPEHEKECGSLMFKLNAPKECIDAGINPSDFDAPRKCGKLMFQNNAPAQCLEVGLTGERRDDEKKCKDLMQGREKQFLKRPTARFDRDCNSIENTDEKMKCYEQFYNNAQVGFSDDFRERELNTKEFAAKMGAANPQHPCPDGVCDKYESSHPGECPEDCGGERGQGQTGPSREACQTSQQIENLKQECLSRGERADVENRGGCPWVVCVSISQGRTVQQERTIQQEFNVYGDFNPYVKEERMQPYESIQPGQYQEPGMAPENRIDQPQQPPQEYQPSQEYPQSPPQTSGTIEPPSTESSSTESSSGGESAPATGAAIFWNYYYK